MKHDNTEHDYVYSKTRHFLNPAKVLSEITDGLSDGDLYYRAKQRLVRPSEYLTNTIVDDLLTEIQVRVDDDLLSEEVQDDCAFEYPGMQKISELKIIIAKWLDENTYITYLKCYDIERVMKS